MSELNLKIKSIALDDLENIANYIAKDNKQAAFKVLKILYKSFNNLCLHPKLGVVRKDFTYKNVRFLKVYNHYLTVYNFDEENVYILRVLSDYQNICELI